MVVLVFVNANAYAETSRENKNRIAAVVGDSYAGKMLEVDKDYKFKYFIFPLPSITEELNVNVFNECLYDDDVKYILYTTSVNDQGRMVNPEIFKKFIHIYAERARQNDKYLFFHTYMNVPHEFIKIAKYKSTDYDNALREIADAYQNVYYIDMNNFNDDRFVLKDKTHFNSLFHETLKAKYLDHIYDIEKNVYGVETEFEKINDKNQIAVTGDSYAGVFYTLEKDKKYTMSEYALPNRTISENEYFVLNALMSNAKYVLLSTSVNDFRKRSDINKFEDMIRRFANIATENSKILFLHTYMDYVYYEDKTATSSDIKKYTIKDYDNVLKKIAEEYDKVIYIDMSEYNNKIYMMPDLIHYGLEFNDALYNKIDYIINIL